MSGATPTVTSYSAATITPTATYTASQIREEMAKQVDQMLPNLDKNDKQIVIEYGIAYSSKVGIKNAKDLLYARIRHWFKRLSCTPCGTEERKKILLRLQNFSMLLCGFMPLKEIKSSIGYKNGVSLPKCPQKTSLNSLYTNKYTETTPEALPDEIKSALKAIKRDNGENAYDVLKREVKTIVFIPYMEKLLRSVTQETEGTVEVFSRTIFIDPLGEMFNGMSPASIMAATIDHETEHIRFYHANGNDEKLSSENSRERSAKIETVHVFKQMLSSDLVSKNDKELILQKLNIYMLNIKYLNGEMGLAPNDNKRYGK